MNFKWDLLRAFRQRRLEDSARHILRKRSRESIARPKATRNITSQDPRLTGI